VEQLEVKQYNGNVSSPGSASPWPWHHHHASDLLQLPNATPFWRRKKWQHVINVETGTTKDVKTFQMQCLKERT
jgi:hypothetical protein